MMYFTYLGRSQSREPGAKCHYRDVDGDIYLNQHTLSFKRLWWYTIYLHCVDCGFRQLWPDGRELLQIAQVDEGGESD